MQHNFYATTKYATTTRLVCLDRPTGCHKTGAIMAGHDDHALHRQNPTSPDIVIYFSHIEMSSTSLRIPWMYLAPRSVPSSRVVSDALSPFMNLLDLSRHDRHEMTSEVYLSPMQPGSLAVASSVSTRFSSNARFLSSRIFGTAAISSKPGKIVVSPLEPMAYCTKEDQSPTSSRQTPRL